MSETDDAMQIAFVINVCKIEVEKIIGQSLGELDDGSPWGRAYLTCLAEVKERQADTVTIPKQLAIDADSELSAIAHGRKPSSKAELSRLSQQFRLAWKTNNCKVSP